MRGMSGSQSSGPRTAPLLEETIGENLRRTALAHGERDALIVRSQRYRATYSELWQQTGAAAAGLLARGVGRGDRVGIWSPNRHEWVIAQYATARIGAILVNINPAYRTSELEYVLRQAEISLLLHAAAFRTTDYRGMVAEVRPRLPALRDVLVLDDDWADLLAAGADQDAVAAREAELSCRDPINIQYTSGTTGFPKGATLSHFNVLNNGYFVGEALRLGPEDRVCIPVPFYHCFGMVLGNLACTTHGSAMVIPGEAFEPLAVLETVQAERCTALYGVPTMFIAELDHPRFVEFDLTCLRTGIMAGSPCPVETMKQVQSRMHMREVTICYGMTETSPVSTQSAVDDPLAKRVSTVGRVHPHVEVKIVDPVERRDGPARHLRRAVHARLQRHDRLLARQGGDRPRHRRRRMDAHRRSGDHGRGRLRQHRRPHQGRHHPRRREHLPARGRGVPAHPSRRQRGAGDRRAERQVRRGGDGLGALQAGRERDRGRAAGPLQGPHRHLQDPALLEVRGPVPDDGHRQGAEVPVRMREIAAEELGLTAVPTA